MDEVGTSDDLLLNLMEGRELVGVRFTQRKRLMDRLPTVRRKARTACCFAGYSADKTAAVNKTRGICLAFCINRPVIFL